MSVQNYQLVRSPSSGAVSPSSPGGSKVGRAAGKKLFKTEIDLLVEAVKLIPTYVKSLQGLGQNEKRTVNYIDDTTKQQYQYMISKKEYSDFFKQIVKRMNALPNMAFSLNRTTRKTAPNSGFLAPARFSAEIVNFFFNAIIGPIVTGNFVIKPKTLKQVPDVGSLRVLQGPQGQETDLRSLLWFIQQAINGQANPLYGIISPGTLTPLFALHAAYSGMKDPRDNTRLIASGTMRQYLAGIMERTIRSDAAKLIAKFSGNQGLAQQVGFVVPQLIAAIGDRNLAVENHTFATGEFKDNKPVEVELFNPNSFLYAHFSKLISNGKVTGDLVIDRNIVAQVYGNGVEGITQMNLQQASPNYENAVLDAQQKDVALARAYKNAVQGKVTATKKKEATAAANRAKLVQQPQIAYGM
jgi:hypothetical protein